MACYQTTPFRRALIFRKACFLFLTCSFCLSSAFGQELDYKGFPQWSWGKKDSSEYYLYSPTSLKPGEKYPVVLFMHGCCGEDYHATLRNAVDPPVRMWHNFGANTQRIPTYIISAKTKVGWRQHFENLKAVIDDLIKNHQGDPQRVYVSGFSMGGAGTWEIIEKYPGFFAAALPMGMDFRGKDPEHYKGIPIWANRGGEDWWSRHLGSQVAVIRELNGGAADSTNWVTGVNPRLTTFAGVGHGVMWDAVSAQDLVGWAYSKVNDGNAYPIIFFRDLPFTSVAKIGDKVPLDISAVDPDGSIDRVEIYVNGKLIQSLRKSPYKTGLVVVKGDTEIRATAIDNQGKSATETRWIHTPLLVTIDRQTLVARRGEYCEMQIKASGNGRLKFFPADISSFPDGLLLSEAGLIRGIATKEGRYSLQITVSDEDGDSQTGVITLQVNGKAPGQVVVTNAKNYAGKRFSLAAIRSGITPYNGPAGGEITFSDGLTPYKGLTFIQTDAKDTVNAMPYYMDFEVDEDVTVYIAYEKRDNLDASTVPDWLKEFQKVKGDQIVAQYFYYDVYAKEFSKGRISLPDAEEQKNKVNANYFVIVKKK